MRRLGRVAVRFRAEPDGRFDDRSIADFARLYLGERDGARFSRWFEDQWLQPAAETSRAAWRELLSGEDAAPVDLVSPGTLPVALQTRWSVSQIAREEESFLLTGASGVSLHADALVLATPADVSAALVADIADSAEIRLLNTVRYRPALAFRARVRDAHAMPSETLASAAIRADVPALSRIAVDSESGEVLAVASPMAAARQIDASDHTTQSVFETALRAALPPEVCDFGKTELFRFARGMTAFEVGHVRRMQTLRKIVRGERNAGRRLVYAGDFLCAPTFAGAARSGVEAAEVLLDRRV